MLKPKVIAQVLRQATRDGVKASLLMTSEGSLLAFAADNDRSAKIYAAIAANVWSTYKQHCSSETFLKGDQTGGLRFILMQCEAQALARHLEEPLMRVASYQNYDNST
ncbi:hypothetical protein PHYBLDRAFT_64257 [Phycomyces blakesleeanus NRRL 1555(-)]|uniref:Roadblock/LAMTOR2 domain-containing protein n=1 Tax=Phycomyces blakesleeanus (strain ATCC 8743b / DSM 1359 / FGSC 10004 / NBRC 33097 / NRRL 1555) TaxID=763407 RepID=A0A163ARR6_PHYB8|nr:hypothetical protein PHYBLDRAFT_64257 [Phycomyces blakesleeanus NRRL 1555(-)]OAD75331.1 hypothetical protein PHYBLDRAFT_64257 [Phycomyces blakesleeanus NRRL 1555(-)]|eukprot:XP_018293371.1 hypothetical protein PHYBLDRAFT_64257 [Phycomyces blakesleeanus NRRL 1555(-)]